MPYSHIKRQGLPLLLLLAGIAPYLNHDQASSAPNAITVAYASHGLRVYVDPETGQFAPPPEPTTTLSAQSFSAQVLSDGTATLTITEQAATRSGGGYSIHLQERFRPSRNGS